MVQGRRQSVRQGAADRARSAAFRSFQLRIQSLLDYPAAVQAQGLRDRKTRLLVGLLLVPALALRVLVPQGFMPGTGAGDAPTMQMCHGAGPLPASTQPLPDGSDPSPSQGQHHESPCVFAAAGSAAPPPVVALALQAPHVDDVDAATPAFIVVHKALHRAQAARAPPARFPHA
jgi:hypothetical protein